MGPRPLCGSQNTARYSPCQPSCAVLLHAMASVDERAKDTSREGWFGRACGLCSPARVLPTPCKTSARLGCSAASLLQTRVLTINGRGMRDDEVRGAQFGRERCPGDCTMLPALEYPQADDEVAGLLHGAGERLLSAHDLRQRRLAALDLLLQGEAGATA